MRWSWKLAVSAASLVLVACSAGGVSTHEDGAVEQESDEAIDPTFDRHNILSDEVFTDEDAVDAATIQAFLAKTPYGNKSVLAGYASNGKTAAQAIATAGKTYGINPIAILTRAQLEQSLVGKSSAAGSSLDYAFGCGCPDGAACSAAWKGFDKQVDCMASHMRSYLDDLAAGSETIAGWKVGKSKKTLDPLTIIPKSRATAALYTYTPWVGEAGGGKKGVGGNSTHHAIWKKFAAALHYAGPSAPVTPPAGGCTTDTECNHGEPGQGIVCANSGPHAGTCIQGCHTNTDCAVGSTCDQSTSTWSCRAEPSPNGGSGDACTPITFPSGVTLARVSDAALTAEYAKLSAACTAPKCFLDVTNLHTPSGSLVDVHVDVGQYFTLYELVRTSVDPNGTGGVDVAHAYSTKVLVDAAMVTKLDALRKAQGAPVYITSAFRSPAHQKAICHSICGADQCYGASGEVTCAKNSRHMWGSAADMSLSYEDAAYSAGFPFVFHENGGTAPHLHVDLQSCK